MMHAPASGCVSDASTAAGDESRIGRDATDFGKVCLMPGSQLPRVTGPSG